MKRLREQWPWNDGFLRLFLIAPTLFGLVAAAVSYPTAGAHALWFLSGALVSVLLTLIYGAVGRGIDRLKLDHQGDPGEVCEGLLVLGAVQSPGLAILRSHELVLVPLVGEGCTLPLDELEVFKEGHMLPGKYVWGKRAFILKHPRHKRLAFAVEESVGERWSGALRQKV